MVGTVAVLTVRYVRVMEARSTQTWLSMVAVLGALRYLGMMLIGDSAIHGTDMGAHLDLMATIIGLGNLHWCKRAAYSVEWLTLGK